MIPSIRHSHLLYESYKWARDRTRRIGEWSPGLDRLNDNGVFSIYGPTHERGHENSAFGNNNKVERIDWASL